MIIRSSFLNEIKACNRKAYYKYILGLTPPGAKSIDLQFGSLVHNAIEKFHLTGDIAEGVKLINSAELPATEKKNIATARGLFIQYANQNNISILFPEQDFKFWLSDDHLWLGRLDGIGQYAVDKRQYIVEYKTTAGNYLQMKPNDQFIGYYVAVKHRYPDLAGSIIINLDPGKMQVKKHIVTFTDAECEDWLQETLFAVDNFERCVENGVFPRNPNACRMYNRDCSYLQLCSTSLFQAEMLASRLYEINEEARSLSW